MEFQIILDYILQYLPTIIAIITEVSVVFALIAKIASYFKKTEDAVNTLKESTEYTALKNQMSNVLEENAKLKKEIRHLMRHLTHVKECEYDKESN